MNEAVIRRMADEPSFQRGLDYFSHGHVEWCEETGEGVQALVRGNREYTVTLTSEDGVLDYDCDCPAGEDGAFCKHCVAAALAFLKQTAASKPGKRSKSKEVTLADAKKILEGEDKAALLGMLLEWAKNDKQLRERLILFAARRSGPDAGVAAVRRAFQKAVHISDFASYREAGGWAQGVHEAIDAIEQLLNEGHAAAVSGLCESAMRSLSNAIQRADDSDGHFSMLRERLEDIHYRACLEARPEPVDLAKRLFHAELDGDYDEFSGAAERYAAILGAKGIKAYRELAEALWAKVPERKAGDRGSDSDSYFGITRIMESLARASGDTEELVAVMSRDLSSGYQYLQIAEVYRESGQHDKALLWAEKGLEAFPERPDYRLHQFAAEEYHRLGRHDDAMKLIWAEFLDRPSSATYEIVRMHAEQAGAWPEWRERSLAEIRTRIAKAKEKLKDSKQPFWMRNESDHSTLVQIFVTEGRDDDAWREANDGGCSEGLWLLLAARRENERPEDAAPIYWKYGAAAVAGVSNGRYGDAVELLEKAAAVMKRLGRSGEFAGQMNALTLKFRIKRNFLKLVEQRRKFLYLS